MNNQLPPFNFGQGFQPHISSLLQVQDVAQVLHSPAQGQVQTIIQGRGLLYLWRANHAVSHEDVDKWMKHLDYLPEVKLVNTMCGLNVEQSWSGDDPVICSLHPSPVDFWQPTHRKHALFIQDSAQMGYGKKMCRQCNSDFMSERSLLEDLGDDLDRGAEKGLQPLRFSIFGGRG